MGVNAAREVRSGEALPAVRPRTGKVERRAKRRFGLSARLLLLTIFFVVLAEVLIYVPTVANYRRAWLSDRIAAAQIAALVLDAAPDRDVSDDLARRLLDGVGAHAIAVQGEDARRLLMLDSMPDEIADTVDLRVSSWIDSIRGAARTMIAPALKPIRVVGQGRDGFELVEILLDERPLRTSMLRFSTRLLISSLIIAVAVASLVFLVLQRLIVRPVRRLTGNIAEFAEDPERADRVIVPSGRGDEIGHAETALARMEIALAGNLRQKRRLAELGVSVSKINHELRNMLTTAQLLGDRLEHSHDPLAQRLAPRLVDTLDRAIRFCEGTLAYGRAAEPHPERALVPLAPIFAELPDLAGLASGASVIVEVQAAPGLRIDADPEQLARVLANLVRNAVQALDTAGSADFTPRVTVTATREGGIGGGRVTILVTDNGPGLPERAKTYLFAPFQGSVRSGGTGLGLAIASELVQLNGGTLSLDQTTAGTRFRIEIPDRKLRRKAS